MVLHINAYIFISDTNKTLIDIATINTKKIRPESIRSLRNNVINLRTLKRTPSDEPSVVDV